METIIPTQLLHPRWLLSSLKDTNSQIIVAQNLSTVTSIIPPPRSSWDVNREFREANCLVTAICESVSSLGMNEYRIAMKALNQVCATQSKRDELHEEGVTQCSTESCNTAATIVMTVDPPSAELSVETVDQSVEQSVENVEQSVENVEQSVVSGEKSVEKSVDSVEQCLAPPNEQLDTEPIDSTAPGFEIASPIRARGRPKQKPKTKKAKKNTAIRMAKADSILHDKQLSLQSITDLVWHEAR
ncbi:hypothetical protein F444_21247 [Phytophthora nicotianae P1976]|uniref:Uncharacterized protein n=1 Tax=Phytophthora nicotianae P1976 TaxID=1317066 RepID=A0A080Z1S2_PHYNI|nr:hypothetical protein F444_21247 [Phytophthora nicotianae P1976]